MSNLLEELKSNEPSVVCAAIEALEAEEPQTLKAQIVPLLLNKNAWVRSRATRAMYRFDKSEALRYFGALLFSKKSIEREAALNNSIFFPFNQIEAFLLKYLTLEQDQNLIQKAGVVFMVNPDKSTAYRLFEAKQATKGLRSNLIASILVGVLNSLYQTKLEKNPPEIQLKNLQKEYESKKTKIYINHFSAMLGSEDSSVRLKAALKLCELKKKNIADVGLIIDEYLNTEEDERVVNQVKLYLHSISSSKPEETALKESKEEIKDTGDKKEKESQISREAMYASINKENYSQIIQNLLSDLKSLPSSEQIRIIGFIKEYGSEKETDSVLSCLESQDYEVQQAAIECVSKINQEALKPYFSNLMKSDSDQVKLAAVNAFALFDKAQVLSLLGQMMISVRASQRKSALFCLENLDFASVSDILVSAVKVEKDKDIRKELFTVLFAYPNEEIFYELYFYYMDSNASEKAELKFFLTKYSEKLALQNIGRKKEDYWKTAEARWSEEKANVAQREAYKLENIQRLLKKDDSKEKIELVRFAFICHSFGLFLTLLIWFGFMAPNAWFYRNANNKDNNKNTEASNVQENKYADFLPTEPITVKGVVTEVSVENKQAMLYDESTGNNYMLIFNEEQHIPDIGNTLSVQIMVEDYENSVYTSEVINVL